MAASLQALLPHYCSKNLAIADANGVHGSRSHANLGSGYSGYDGRRTLGPRDMTNSDQAANEKAAWFSVANSLTSLSSEWPPGRDRG